MKNIIKFIAIAVVCVCSGCKQLNCTSPDMKPVAPKTISNDTSDKQDPQLPDPNVWWR